MKTAMQKLKSISKDLHKKYHEDITLQWLVDNIDDFIKEEKEQIINTYWDAYKEGQISSDITAEEYYNQNYKNNE